MKLSELAEQITGYIIKYGDEEVKILMTNFGKTGVVRDLCIKPFNDGKVECIIDYNDE